MNGQIIISLYPDSEHYYWYLGNLYQEKGELESAKENYNKALSINPDFGRAKDALKKLNK
ncbi:MAG: tetratricopeptide repeat protein [Bacteroidetes bacterium]|nr:tetratricopeptide repeat protein [Bacteroidota bacterium]